MLDFDTGCVGITHDEDERFTGGGAEKLVECARDEWQVEGGKVGNSF